MSEDIRRRSACDRCHSQKLRCPKRPGADICERCLKAKAPCAYSPFRQKKPVILHSKGQLDPKASECHDGTLQNAVRPLNTIPGQVVPHERLHQNEGFEDMGLKLATGPQDSQQPTSMPDQLNFEFDFLDADGGEAGTGFDDLDLGLENSFPPFDFNTLSPTSGPFTPKSCAPSFYTRAAYPASPDFAPTTERKSVRPWIMKQVPPEKAFSITIPVALNFNFEEEALGLESSNQCVARLSKLSVDLHEHAITVPISGSTDSDLPTEQCVMQEALQRGYRLDETFRVTQEMIDVYPSVLNIASRRQILGSDCVSGTYFGTISTMDYATVLLAISCHLRLTAIFETLFYHSRVCIKMRKFQTDPCRAAPIKVGSFTPPPSSAVPMQMLLIVHMSTQLSSFADQLVTWIKDDSSTDNIAERSDDDASPNVLRLSLGAAENVKKKAHGLTENLSKLRNEMLQSGLLA